MWHPLRRLARVLCRHELMLARSSGRFWLQCAKCGHRTPGWDVPITVAAPTRRLRAVSSRRRAGGRVQPWGIEP